MIYKFKSKSTGDVIMLGPDGDALMRLLGRDPSGQGIIDVADMPGALAALELALKNEAQQPPPANAVANAPAGGNVADDAASDAAVSLRRRLWPMMEMLRRAQAAGNPIVWGV